MINYGGNWFDLLVLLTPGFPVWGPCWAKKAVSETVWTADDWNCYILFQDVTLKVRGDIRNPVPEPSPILLVGFGLVGVWGMSRKGRGRPDLDA